MKQRKAFVPSHNSENALLGLFSRPVLIGCLINGSMGIMYAWSLFILPLERELGMTRAELSAAPSFAIGFFTLGMLLHKAILFRLSYRGAALFAFGLASGGHLLFALWPSVLTLVVGYGVIFGFGVGLGYGLALEMAQFVQDRGRAIAIGVIVSSFALSGAVISAVFASAILSTPPQTVFLWIALLYIAVGGWVGAKMIRQSPADTTADDVSADNQFAVIASAGFLMMAFCFFCICFAGLLSIAHIAAILKEKGFHYGLIALGVVLLNLGYILGSLFGGKTVEWLKGRAALLSASVLMLLALLSMYSGGVAIVIAATFTIGLIFGASASLVPVLIGYEFGSAKIGQIYGYMIFAYGLAGSIAPWFGGALYTYAGSYFAPLTCAALLAASSVIVALIFVRRETIN